MQYGLWTVLARVDRKRVRVRCACGLEVVRNEYDLRAGNSRQCRSCRNRNRKDMNVKHGASRASGRTPTWLAWSSMRARCNNPKRADYARYGGRGIKVCTRWQMFKMFLEDMGERPERGYTLDRINNDGDYEPGNCRWATWAQQARNKGNNRRITHEGETLTIAEWAARLHISYQTLWQRLRTMEPGTALKAKARKARRRR